MLVNSELTFDEQRINSISNKKTLDFFCFLSKNFFPVQMGKTNILQQINCMDYLHGYTCFSSYIELYEACHPPVQMKNTA